jgi:hypothetical protein
MLQRLLTILAVAVFVSLVANFIFHGYQLYQNQDAIVVIVHSFLFTTFIVSSVYFLFFVVTILGHFKDFFQSVELAGRHLIGTTIFAGILIVLIIYGVLTKLFIFDPKNISVFLIALPSALLAFSSTIFDLAVCGRQPFSKFGFRLKPDWARFFKDILRTDVAVAICFVLLIAIALLTDTDRFSAEADKTNILLFVTGGEAFVLYLSTLLFVVDSLIPDG